MLCQDEREPKKKKIEKNNDSSEVRFEKERHLTATYNTDHSMELNTFRERGRYYFPGSARVPHSRTPSRLDFQKHTCGNSIRTSEKGAFFPLLATARSMRRKKSTTQQENSRRNL